MIVYWKVSLYSTSTKRMLFSSGSVSRGPFLSHQAGYHYHSYSLGLVLKSTITIHEYTSLFPFIWKDCVLTGTRVHVVNDYNLKEQL